ncbi:MAG: SpoIID/LytB domain-containing protein [Crocinitomicaceae bacterium]
MRIGILRKNSVKKILFSYDQGSYAIFGDSTYFGTILPNEFVDLSFETSGRLHLKKGATDLGSFKKVFLIQNKASSSIALNSKIPVAKLRKYKDDFEITAMNTDLRIVNLVDMDNYLAGVVESEGGGKKELEYYKVQAIMSRTYAKKYQAKHSEEGFELCDGVHCQAYHSMLRFTPKIDTAVRATSGLIMVDQNQKNVDAYFHANCGGQTCLPEYVWNNSVPYLSTFKDTFCIYTKQANWTTKISKGEWRSFMVNTYNYPVDDPEFGPQLYNFTQKDRLAFFVSPALGIPLRDIRLNFKLKSTYFSCHEEGDYVVLNGRGFGHGVGLCQEGAMKMAHYGYNYEQIILFYFPGVHFRDLITDSFFAQECNDLHQFDGHVEYQDSIPAE